MEVEMKIRGLMMDPVTNMPIVMLKDVNGSAVLPIWVGIYEANAIALEIEKVSTPRPMTHDLIKQPAVRPRNRRQKSGGQRTEGRHLLRRDLAGAQRRADSAWIRGRATRWRWRCAWIARSTWTRRVLKIVEDGRGGRRQGRQQRRTAPLAGEPERRGSRPLQDVTREAREACRRRNPDYSGGDHFSFHL